MTQDQYTPAERQTILQTVDLAIDYGLKHHQIISLNLNDYPPNLTKLGASFVTLEIDHKLRGCIGSLEAHQPLIVDVAKNAFYAAFHDTRFAPVRAAEAKLLTKHVSILSAPEPMSFTSEADLLQQLCPGIDGLILSDQGRRGTFLPAVWESLREPREFLQNLKLKAGFSPDYWSKTLRVERYTTLVISSAS